MHAQPTRPTILFILVDPAFPWLPADGVPTMGDWFRAAAPSRSIGTTCRPSTPRTSMARAS
jgi:hypothetical protein